MASRDKRITAGREQAGQLKKTEFECHPGNPVSPDMCRCCRERQVCYSIATRHKAAIRVDTGPGGTVFYVRFPIKAGLGT